MSPAATTRSPAAWFSRSLIAVLLAATVGSALAGCAGSALRGRRLDRLVADSTEIVAVAGQPIVITMHRLEGDSGSEDSLWIPPAPPRVELPDRSAITATLYWVAIEQLRMGPDNWLPPARIWGVVPWAEIASGNEPLPAYGFWALLIDSDPAIQTDELLLDGVATPLVWIEPNDRPLDLARSPRLAASGPALERLDARLAHESSDALRRWRVSILRDRWRGSELSSLDLSDPAEHPVIHALARHNEERWRAALRSASQLDRASGATLLNILTAIVLSPDGELLPAWPPETQDDRRLQLALISPDTNSAQRRRALTTWLDQQPPSISWVIDDSQRDRALDNDSVRRDVVIGVSELRGVDLTTSLAAIGEAAHSPTRLRGHRSSSAVVEVSLSRNGEESDIVVRAGYPVRALRVLRHSLPVRPPGIMIGPLIAEHSIWAWRDGLSARPGSGLISVAMLDRSATGRWRLHIECATPGPPTSGDGVRIWLGSRPSGEAIVVGAGGDDERVETGPNGWRATVELPHSAIGDDQLLRIGLERAIPGVGRFSWPRPMLPGQRQPGRATLDLSTWGSLALGDEGSVR